ncbi:hypothetical protein BC936DRAFT_146714 [Jimgerdemannia flammicorona]|uniref:Uncharacterized protein n=1 Tax=Jimgerdemannia flammicorona TaxID=994334 RepID=A0A433D712_9FUNG|nr:hypothetical protein BC936DRAFT_146714 [Jimgerdemannia flammicorona]
MTSLPIRRHQVLAHPSCKSQKANPTSFTPQLSSKMYQQPYNSQDYYDQSQYVPYGTQGSGLQQRHQAHSPPPLQHPIPTHPIPSFCDAPSPQPPAQQHQHQQQARGQPMGSPQQGMPDFYQNFGFNDPAAQMGMQFAGSAMKKGSEYVEQNGEERVLCGGRPAQGRAHDSRDGGCLTVATDVYVPWNRRDQPLGEYPGPQALLQGQQPLRGQQDSATPVPMAA